jgi:hypothetical protein
VRRTRIAKGIGVGWSTIEQWLPKTNKRRPRKLFRRLSVTKSQATDARDRVGVEGATSTRIVVTSSSGLMIEGLTVLELSELLRRFGC